MWAFGPAATNTIDFNYDLQFNSLGITDQLGRAVERYTLDLQDRPVSVTNLEGQAMTILYNLQNFVRQVTRFDGTVVSNTYDNGGRLSRVRFSDLTNNFSYFGNDILNTASNPLGKVTLSYNQANWLTTAAGLGTKGSVTYGYLPAGNVSNVTSIAGTNLYTYDAAERVTAIQHQAPSAKHFLYAYNPTNGLAASMTVSIVGLTASYGYDVLDRSHRGPHRGRTTGSL